MDLLRQIHGAILFMIYLAIQDIGNHFVQVVKAAGMHLAIRQNAYQEVLGILIVQHQKSLNSTGSARHDK